MLVDAFPALSRSEQNLALTLYLQLAKGQAVQIDSLATLVSLRPEQVLSKLKHWPGVFFNKDQCVIGFWGLSVQKMNYLMKMPNSICYAWCAWDTLFIPQLIKQIIEVTSVCPISSQSIQLQIFPTEVLCTEKNKPLVSFVQPDRKKLENNIIQSFCHSVYFLSNRAAAEKWILEYPNSILLTLSQAFEIGQQVNQQRYSNFFK